VNDIKHGRVLRPSLGVDGHSITEHLSTGLTFRLITESWWRGYTAEAVEF
jgi:hypothetical protein